MTPELKTFLNAIGVKKEAIESLTSEEKPEDFKVEDLVEEYQNIQSKLFENKYKDRIVDEKELDTKFEIQRETLANKINKAFELGFTRKEVKEMGYDSILEKANEAVAKKIQAGAAETDEQLVNQLKTLQKANAETRQELESAQERYERELREKEQQFSTQLRDIKVDNLFQKEFEKYQFGLDAELIPVVKEKIQSEVRSRYEVSEDGRLSGKDGTHAQDFEGKGIYDSLAEPVHYLLEKFKAIKKSHGGNNGKPVDNISLQARKGKFVADKNQLSPAAQRILDAARNQD